MVSCNSLFQIIFIRYYTGIVPLPIYAIKLGSSNLIFNFKPATKFGCGSGKVILILGSRIWIRHTVLQQSLVQLDIPTRLLTNHESDGLGEQLMVGLQDFWCQLPLETITKCDCPTQESAGPPPPPAPPHPPKKKPVSVTVPPFLDQSHRDGATSALLAIKYLTMF